MKWYDNNNSMCKKGYERLWILRRLKGLGATKIRSVLELAVSVWDPGLTKEEENQIERVQMPALRIIF